MTEIRAPRPEELDDMLAVMCEAFRLPFASARAPFYHDPYFDADNNPLATPITTTTTRAT